MEAQWRLMILTETDTLSVTMTARESLWIFKLRRFVDRSLLPHTLLSDLVHAHSECGRPGHEASE
jgi:hypothetical protein